MKRMEGKKKYVIMIVTMIIVILLIISLLELYKNSIEKNKERIEILTQSSNITETPDSNEVVTEIKNENKVIRENVVTEDITIPTPTEETTEIETNKQTKNSIKTTDDKTKSPSPEIQEQSNNSKNNPKKNEEKISITVEGNDEKYPIQNDEGQWYTQSDWFEIEEDVTFIESEN